MKKLFVLAALILTLFTGCRKPAPPVIYYHYPRLANLTDSLGGPRNKYIGYFPDTLIIQDSLIANPIEPRRQARYSGTLVTAHEPLLYNYYLGHSMYRFTWLRSFNYPTFFTLHRSGDSVWLSIKMLDRHPNVEGGMKTVHFKIDGMKIKLATDTITNTDDYYAKFLIHKTKTLSLNEWFEFQHLLEKASFRKWRNVENTDCVDGSNWIIEEHLPNSYWYTQIHSPSGSFKSCGEYLIKLCDKEDSVTIFDGFGGIY